MKNEDNQAMDSLVAIHGSIQNNIREELDKGHDRQSRQIKYTPFHQLIKFGLLSELGLIKN